MKLFEPYSINNKLLLKNHIMMPPVVNRLATTEGHVTEASIDRYMLYAKGGCGHCRYGSSFGKKAKKRADKEAAMAKLFAEQVVTGVSEMALRIHGGIGYTRAYPIERHFRDARSYHFEEGTEEIQKLLISRYLLR